MTQRKFGRLPIISQLLPTSEENGTESSSTNSNHQEQEHSSYPSPSSSSHHFPTRHGQCGAAVEWAVRSVQVEYREVGNRAAVRTTALHQDREGILAIREVWVRVGGAEWGYRGAAANSTAVVAWRVRDLAIPAAVEQGAAARRAVAVTVAQI